MNKEQKKDYFIGVFLVLALFISGLILNLATEFMLLTLALLGIRFTALSRNKEESK